MIIKESDDFEFYKFVRQRGIYCFPNKDLDDETLMRDYEAFLGTLSSREMRLYDLAVRFWAENKK